MLWRQAFTPVIKAVSVNCVRVRKNVNDILDDKVFSNSALHDLVSNFSKSKGISHNLHYEGIYDDIKQNL